MDYFGNYIWNYINFNIVNKLILLMYKKCVTDVKRRYGSQEKMCYSAGLIFTYSSNEKNPLCEPYVKHISIGKYRELYEIRMKVSGNMVRVLFVKQGEDIVLLYAFYRKSGKDTEKALGAAFKMLNKMRKTVRQK